MVDSVNSVGNADYFTKNDLPEKYDFNKDGKVDIADYNLAASALAEPDTETYEGLTKNELETAFKSLLSQIGTAADTEITADNARKTAKTIIDDIKSGKLSPKVATSFNHLQGIGKTLSEYIKQCSALKQIFSEMIETEKKELEEIAKRKEEKEAEYASKEAEVQSKTQELSTKMIAALALSKRLSDTQRKKADEIIRESVKNYKEGKYPGKALTDVITQKLATTGDTDYGVNALKTLLKGNSERSLEIKHLCADIDTLVCDIKSVNEEYNQKNTTMNTNIELRNQIIEVSTTASQLYQSGYQQRIDMRTAMHDKYHVEGNGKVTAKNEQVQMLNEFLTNKELDNMPFADAWEVLSTTFDNCGIKFGKDGSLKVPKGHDDTAKNVYKEFVETVKRLYTKTPISQYDEDEFQTPGATGGVTEVTGVKRTDPISFSVGNVKYEFISDNNNNGVFDDASEFLGANNGWAEMKIFDADGNGLISGDELKDLKLVSINQQNGQYSFVSAEEAGIEAINLNSFKGINNTEINNNITVGSFDIKMEDGSTIKGTQTEDTMKNMQNNYSNLFGSDIDDLSETYEANPFMEDFVESMNTNMITNTAAQDVKQNTEKAQAIVNAADKQIKHKVINSSIKAAAEKRISDEYEAKEREKAEEKQKAEEEALAKKEKEELELKEIDESKEKAEKTEKNKNK